MTCVGCASSEDAVALHYHTSNYFPLLYCLLNYLKLVCGGAYILEHGVSGELESMVIQ